jgi:hypothetical protein
MSAAYGSTAANSGGTQEAICLADGTGQCVTLGGVLSCSNLTFGAAAGSSPTCVSVSGYDSNFVVVMQEGTAPTGGDALFTITFTTTRGHPSACVMTTELSSYTSLAQIPENSPDPSATSTFVYGTSTTLTPGNSYIFNVVCP